MWVENWLALRLFFPEPDAKGWPEALLDPELVGEEVIGGLECYLIRGHDGSGWEKRLWVSKGEFLVVQDEMAAQRKSPQPAVEDMSWPPPEQVGRHRGVPGKTLQWLVGRVVLWKVKRDLRAELQSRAAADPGYRAVVTTTYETIVANRYLAPAEFALSMPPQGVLDDDFWQRIVARREALEEVARERREAAGASHALTEEPRAEDTGP